MSKVCSEKLNGREIITMTYEKLEHDIELLQKVREKKDAWAYAYECAYMQRGFDLLTHQQKEVIDFLELIVKCLPYISENYCRFYFCGKTDYTLDVTTENRPFLCKNKGEDPYITVVCFDGKEFWKNQQFHSPFDKTVKTVKLKTSYRYSCSQYKQTDKIVRYEDVREHTWKEFFEDVTYFFDGFSAAKEKIIEEFQRLVHQQVIAIQKGGVLSN